MKFTHIVLLFCIQLNAQDLMMPHRHNGRFYSYPGEETKSNHLFEEIYMFIHSKILQWLAADSRNPDFTAMDNWLQKASPKPTSQEPVITWIGHATFLIQLGNINILTDPIFGDAFPVLYPRVTPPALTHKELPLIDVILISHNHWDHFCCKSLKKICRTSSPFMLVPQGDLELCDQSGFDNVFQYTWWEQQPITLTKELNGITFTFVPAIHWSYQLWLNSNRALWGGWLIEYEGFKIYFAGDTAYGEHFKQIGEQFPNIDVALLPIGPCEYHDWLKETHMSAQEAVQAFLDLGARHFIPMHWGSFNFGLDYLTTPIERLIIDWYYRSSDLAGKELHLVKAGQEVAEFT